MQARSGHSISCACCLPRAYQPSAAKVARASSHAEGTAAGACMDTVRVNIAYRPLRICWAIKQGDFAAFREVVRTN